MHVDERLGRWFRPHRDERHPGDELHDPTVPGPAQPEGVKSGGVQDEAVLVSGGAQPRCCFRRNDQCRARPLPLTAPRRLRALTDCVRGLRARPSHQGCRVVVHDLLGRRIGDLERLGRRSVRRGERPHRLGVRVAREGREVGRHRRGGLYGRRRRSRAGRPASADDPDDEECCDRSSGRTSDPGRLSRRHGRINLLGQRS
jgi:hypothetical protein